jgi:hypothetical protein
MRNDVTAVIALVGMLVPATVLAQAASVDTETQLQQEMRHRRVIVRPTTPPGEVQRDADQAATEVLQQKEREQAVVRDLTRPVPRAPQADQDLKGGIQTRSLNNALRR